MILKPITLSEYASKAENKIGVFGSEQWLSVYGNKLRYVGIFRDDHQLIGGFFYLPHVRFGFLFLKLPPYTPHCGFFIQSQSTNRAALSSFYKEVMGEVRSYVLRQRAALNILAFPSEVSDLQPFIWSKFKVIPNYTYRLDLSETLEHIHANFDPKNRNVLSKVRKEELEIGLDQLDAEQLYEFFKHSLLMAGANVYAELRSIFSGFHGKGSSFVVSAKKNGELMGAVFCVYDQECCYYLLGGQNTGSVNGINNLLLYKSIEKAKELGCRMFDFEGSMLPGVERFFRGFGGALVPYYTVNKASFLLECLLKFKKREIF